MDVAQNGRPSYMWYFNSSNQEVNLSEQAAVPVATVTVSPTTATILAGTTTTLIPTTKDANGTTLTGRTITWTSSNNLVATVANGLVTGVAVGTAIITATSEGKNGFATVTVASVSSQELVINGGFEQAASGWNFAGDAYATTTLNNARTGVGYAYLGANGSGTAKDNAIGSFYQSVTIPQGSGAVTLSFWYYITTQETTTASAYDVMNVTVNDAAGATLATVAVFSNLSKTTGYVTKTFDMTPYRGRTVRIRFGATSDGGLPTVFRIDDVSIK